MTTYRSLKAAFQALDREVRRELAIEAYTEAERLGDRFRQVTARWKNKPRFITKRTITAVYIVAENKPIGSGALIFGYIDKGTKPYTIRSKTPGKKLAFKTAYSARTAPVAKFNKGDGKAHGNWVQKDEVRHPGIRARKFTVIYALEARKTIVQRMGNAVRRGIARA